VVCSLRFAKLICTGLAAVFANVLWFQANDWLRRQGYANLSADVSGPVVLTDVYKMVMMTVFGFVMALALDTLMQ